MRVAVLTLALCLPLAADTGFRLREQRVEVLAGDDVVARSPAEGLWSVACDWQNGWPTAWQHAAPTRTERAGDATIVHAELKACGGHLAAS